MLGLKKLVRDLEKFAVWRLRIGLSDDAFEMKAREEKAGAQCLSLLRIRLGRRRLGLSTRYFSAV